MEFNEGKSITNVHVGQQKSHGLHVYSNSTVRSGTAILKKTKELQRKEAKIVGNDSENVVNKLATTSYNDQQKRNQLNRIKSAIKPSIASANRQKLAKSPAVQSVASQNIPNPNNVNNSLKSKLNSVYQNRNK